MVRKRLAAVFRFSMICYLQAPGCLWHDGSGGSVLRVRGMLHQARTVQILVAYSGSVEKAYDERLFISNLM